jgi:hypothetical protein
MLPVADAVPWYLNPVFLPAASGLLGVILGGLITAVSTYFLDERRAAQERAREGRNEAIDVSRAARMITQDLDIALKVTEAALKKQTLAKLPSNITALANWRDNIRLVAAELSVDGWEKLTMAKLTIVTLRLLYEGEEPLDFFTVDVLMLAIKRLKEGLDVLRPLLPVTAD